MSPSTQIRHSSPPPLRAVRVAQGLTLRQAAGQAGIDPAHLSRVERGESSLSLDALYRLARVLGIRQLADLLQQYRLDLPPETRVPALAGTRGTRGDDRGSG